MIIRERKTERWPVVPGEDLELRKESIKEHYQDDQAVQNVRITLSAEHRCGFDCHDQARDNGGQYPCEGLSWHDYVVTYDHLVYA